MVEQQLRRRGIVDERILAAFRAVPREQFVDSQNAPLAYGDHPLPIEAGQTISQPYIVALMISAAAIRAGDKVLEIGAGSGYAAAIIGKIASKVIAIERQFELVELARARVRALGYANVEIVAGDGSKGCEEEAPFDAILAAASGSHVPSALVDQLKVDGRIVMPIGEPHCVQQLVKVTKRAGDRLIRENLGDVRFVPLIGEEGWKNA